MLIASNCVLADEQRGRQSDGPVCVETIQRRRVGRLQTASRSYRTRLLRLSLISKDTVALQDSTN